MRIHHYDTGAITPVNDVGKLQVDRIHDIEIDVTAEGIVVRADRNKLGEVKSVSSDTEGFISIGPAFGSVVTIEKLEVLKLDDR